MQTMNARRPALGAALLLALTLCGAARPSNALGDGAAGAVAGWDLHWRWDRGARGAPHSNARIADHCTTDYDHGWDAGALAALRLAYREGNRGLPFCDRPASCEHGRSAQWMRGYHDGYAAGYRSAYDFGQHARRRGLGRRAG